MGSVFLLETYWRTAISPHMEKVLVIGASGGIGSALCKALEHQSFEVIRRSRSTDGFDITDPKSIENGLAGLSGLSGVLIATGALEINGATPERRLSDINAEAMAAQFAVNSIGPALILSHIPRLLRKDSRAICATLSARVGSIGDNDLGGWISYRASKAALNQIVKTASIELKRSHPKAICAAIHPGTVQTPFTKKYATRHPTVPADDAAANILRVLSTLTPSQTGSFFDWAGKEIPW